MPNRIRSKESNSPQSFRLPVGLISQGSVSSLIQTWNNPEQAKPSLPSKRSGGLRKLSDTIRQRRDALAAKSAFFDPDAVQVSYPQEVSQGNSLTTQGWTGRSWVKEDYTARKNAKILRATGHVGGQSAAPFQPRIPSPETATATAAGLPLGQSAVRGSQQAGKQKASFLPLLKEHRTPLPEEWFPILGTARGKPGIEQHNDHMEKLKGIGRKHGLEFELPIEDEEGHHHHEHFRDRLQHKIRTRNHRQCHCCGTMYEFYNVCLQCGHQCCRECPRIAPTKTERAKKIAKGCCSRKRQSELQQSLLEDSALPNDTVSGYGQEASEDRPAGMNDLLNHVEEAIMNSSRGRSRSSLEAYREEFITQDTARGDSVKRGRFAPLPKEDSYESNDSYSLRTLQEEGEGFTLRSRPSASQAYRRGQGSSSDWNSSQWTRDRPDSGRAPKEEASVNRRPRLRRNRSSCMVEHLQPFRADPTPASRETPSENTGAKYDEHEEHDDSYAKFIEASRKAEQQANQRQSESGRTVSILTKPSIRTATYHQTVPDEGRAHATTTSHASRNTKSYQTTKDKRPANVSAFLRRGAPSSRTSEKISATKPTARSTHSLTNLREESTAAASSSTGQGAPVSSLPEKKSSSKLKQSQRAPWETVGPSLGAVATSPSGWTEASVQSAGTEPTKFDPARNSRKPEIRQPSFKKTNPTSYGQLEANEQSGESAQNPSNHRLISREQGTHQSVTEAPNATSYDQREASARSGESVRNQLLSTQSPREPMTGQSALPTKTAASYNQLEAGVQPSETTGNGSKPARNSPEKTDRQSASESISAAPNGQREAGSTSQSRSGSARSSSKQRSYQSAAERASSDSYGEREDDARPGEGESVKSSSTRHSRARMIRKSLSDIASIASYEQREDDTQPGEGSSIKLDSDTKSRVQGLDQHLSDKASVASYGQREATSKPRESVLNNSERLSNSRVQEPGSSSSDKASITYGQQESAVKTDESTLQETRNTRNTRAQRPRPSLSRKASVGLVDQQDLVDQSKETTAEKPETSRLSHAKSSRHLHSRNRQRTHYSNGLRRPNSIGAMPLVVVHLTNQFITQVTPADSLALSESVALVGKSPTVTASSIAKGTISSDAASASIIKRWQKVIADSTSPPGSSVGDSGTISSSDILSYRWPANSDKPLPQPPTSRTLSRKGSAPKLPQDGPIEQPSQPLQGQALRRRGNTVATSRPSSENGSVAAKAKTWEKDGVVSTPPTISERSKRQVDRGIEEKKADSPVDGGETASASEKKAIVQDIGSKKRGKNSVMKISIEILREKAGSARKNEKQKGRSQLVTDVELRMDMDGDSEGG